MSEYYPHFDALADRQSAQVIQVESLGRGGIAAVISASIICVALSCIGIALAISAKDRAVLAEREARIAQDKYTYVQGELAKKGIFITTDGH